MYISIYGGQSDIERFRSTKQMFVEGRRVPKPLSTFEEASFPREIHDTLMRQGFVEPTPIQAQGWPMALSGRDFVGIAQTGSGKTIGVCFHNLHVYLFVGRSFHWSCLSFVVSSACYSTYQ